jgi:hypothetical protein
VVKPIAAVERAAARRYLRELANVNLIQEYLPGRYRMRDLLRAYAAELAHAESAQAERTQAIRREKHRRRPAQVGVAAERCR